MALDTARRRKSAICVSLPFRSILPSPDGQVEAEDRYSVGLHYSGLVASAPTFNSQFPSVLVVDDTGSHVYQIGALFSGVTEYAIDPAVEASWAFDTGTGELTIDTDTSDAGNYGPYVVTGTNAAGSAASNTFQVTIANVPSGAAVPQVVVLINNVTRRSNWRL